MLMQSIVVAEKLFQQQERVYYACELTAEPRL